MRYWSIIFLFFIFIGSAYCNESMSVIKNAELKFKSGEIRDGKTILFKALSNNEKLSDEEKAGINNKIAWFYVELVGDYRKAQRYSRNVLKYSLPASHLAITEAKNRIKKLKQYSTKYREENILLRKMQREATNRTDAKNKIKALEGLIINNPEYPDIPVAYHYIGKHYFYLENYYNSYKALSKVLKTRPGIIFLLPTESLRDTAKLKWEYFFANIISKIIIIVSLIIITILLYLSKFWEWMNLKYLKILPLIIIIWSLFLICSSWILNFFIPEQKHLYLVAPYFIQVNPFSPGSGILVTIFFYGILGIICSFLLTLATGRFNWPKTRITINSTILILFMSSLFTIFYLNNCYTNGIFEKRANSISPMITGHTYLPEKDFEPLILTNPRKYQNLTISNTSDQIFIDWINKQYSIISSQSAENALIK